MVDANGLNFLSGGGELGKLIRAKDWSKTPIGSPEAWPQSLRTAVSLCLASNFPINIVWGPEAVQIYNDGYRDCCGDAHPRALGEDYRITWASAWPAIGESFERAGTGETMYLENRRMFLRRLHGGLEETFFTFSHSPIRDETGGIGGLFHPVTETTATMLAERRTRALRDLSAGLAAAANAPDVARDTIEVLSGFEFDLPFLLYYALDPAAGIYRLAAHHGIAPENPAAVPTIEADGTDPWPFAEAGRTRRVVAIAVKDLRGILQGSSCGPYEEQPARAFVIPINVPSAERLPAILLVGVSPRLRLDDAYRNFYDLLGVTISGALATVRAREDERRRTEALAEIDRAKTLFFSNVSHEFRTPLTLMLGPLEEMLGRDTAREEDRDRLLVAHRNGLRLLKMVNSLLDFSRVEAGRAQAFYRAADLAALTADLASNFRSACERAGLRLLVDCPPLSEPVHVDRDMWEKVVLNLVSNAFKFTFGGEIAVSVRARDGMAEMAVRDTGTGIPQVELPRVFERFHRVENASGRTHEGTGIGLALVQELVRLHGGTVTVESVVGVGTTFTVRVPFGTAHLPPDRIDADTALASTATRADAFVEEMLRWLPDPAAADILESALDPPVSASVESDRPRILLADDNADMRDHLRRILGGRYDVEALADGAAALAAARARRPDLVVADVMMPRLDGVALLRALRADSVLRDVPVILLSARAGEEARVEGLEAGADDYLAKPFSAHELSARVGANLKLARVRREAAETLRRSEERLRALVTAISYAVYSMGPNWTEMRRLDGRGFLADTPEPSKSWLDEYIHPDDQPQVWAVIQQAIRTKSVFDLEHRVRRADGTLGWNHSRAVPLLDAAGEIREWFGAASDVTARRRAEEALREVLERGQQELEALVAARTAELMAAEETLRQTQKIEAVGQLTGGIAHDFNNMLQGVTGGLDLARRRMSQGRVEEANRYLDASLEAAGRAAGLTRRLLAFARRQRLEPKPLDVDGLVAGLADLVRRTMEPTVTVDLELGNGGGSVLCDPSELESALLNLCINARDAMPGGGRLAIGTEDVTLAAADIPDREAVPGSYVAISVADTGTGMPPEVLERVFEPFFTTKPQGQGTGLGLSQVWGFVRQSGGLVRIDSATDRGTTVRILLPLHAGVGSVAEAPPLPAPAEADTRATVLLVDDEELVRRPAADRLRELGYTVVEARDGPEALRVLASARPDLLVTDVGLPGGMNGRQVAEVARERRPDLPVLFITGYAGSALPPGIEVIGKPFELDALVRRVGTLLGASLRPDRDPEHPAGDTAR